MNIGHEILYLSRADIEAINLPMSELMDILEQAYIEKKQRQSGYAPKTRHCSRPGSFYSRHALLAAGDARSRTEMGWWNQTKQK